MRMKKILFIAAVALAAAACSKTFDTNPAASQKAIGFGSWSENLTKAEARVQGTSTFLAGDTFSVSGYKDKTTPAPVTVFDNVEVTASGAPVDTWTYTTLRFWDTNYDSYTFYAVSPAAAATMDAQAGTIAATSKTFSGDDNDILVADKVTVAKGSTPYFNNYATVDLTFKHAATMVDVKVKKSHALANNVVTIKAFSMNDIYNEGTFAVTGYTAGNAPIYDWNATGTTNYGPGAGVTSVTIPIAIAEDNTFDSSNTDPA